MPAGARPRSTLPRTAAGTNVGAFTPSDWGLLAAVALIWGSSFLLMAIGLEALRPGVVTLAGVALGAAALALVPAARRGVDRRDLPRIALLGVVWIGVPLTLFPIAQQWIDSSVAGIINGAVPVLTVVWATTLRRRAPGRRQLLGIAIGFVGVVAVFVPEVGESRSTALGAALVTGAVVLYGLAANLTVPLQQR